MVPMWYLHVIVSFSPAYGRPLQSCQGGGHTSTPLAEAPTSSEGVATGAPTFVIIPQMEFMDTDSPGDPCIHILLTLETTKRRPTSW